MQQRVAGRHVTCSPVPYVAGRFTFWSLLLLFIITFDKYSTWAAAVATVTMSIRGMI